MARFRDSETSLARLAKADRRRPKDIDPEDDAVDGSSVSSEGESLEQEADRSHYAQMPESKLRRHADSAAELGADYQGQSVTRRYLNDDLVSDESSIGIASDENVSSVAADEDLDVSGSDEDSSLAENLSSDSDEGSESNDKAQDDLSDSGTRREMQKILVEDRQAIASTINAAAQADMAKGRALKRQQQGFDSLVNVRIKLQKGLVATNGLQTVPSQKSVDESVLRAETAALKLWTELDTLRSQLYHTSNAEPVIESESCWARMQQHESHVRLQRRRMLDKWSQRANPITTSRSSKPQQSLSQGVDRQLEGSNMTRLVARTRVARSCAPTHQGEDTSIFDDADFYTLLLRELVNSRTHAGVSQNLLKSLPSQKELRPRKQVDTKASKGRKMRYTTHEKLVNFLVAEDRGSWQERQRDELFGSLFGQQVSLGEQDHDSDPGDMRLF